MLRAQKSLMRQRQLVADLEKKISKKSLKELKASYEEYVVSNRCNVWAEPVRSYVVMGSSGCELTDAIYAAAYEAGVDIVDFEKLFECQNVSEQKNAQIHCNHSCFS